MDDIEAYLANIKVQHEKQKEHYLADRLARSFSVTTSFGEVYFLDGFPFKLECKEPVEIKDTIKIEQQIMEEIGMPLMLFRCTSEPHYSNENRSYEYAAYHPDTVFVPHDRQRSCLGNREDSLNWEPERIIGLWNGDNIFEMAILFSEWYGTMNQGMFWDIEKVEITSLRSYGFPKNLLKKSRIGLAELQKLVHFVDKDGKGLCIPLERNVLGREHSAGEFIVTKNESDTLNVIFCLLQSSYNARYRIDWQSEWVQTLKSQIYRFSSSNMVLNEFPELYEQMCKRKSR